MALATGSEVKKVFYGTFIHSISLERLEILEKAAIGVNEKGIIAFIYKDVDESELAAKVKTKYGWETWETIKRDSGSITFFFPGFVG
jgi:guanine deaminase